MIPSDLINLLPLREFWFVADIAKAFGVTTRAIQYTAERKKIGRKVRCGPRGAYIFLEEDLPLLCKHVHIKPGKPKKVYENIQPSNGEREARGN